VAEINGFFNKKVLLTSKNIKTYLKCWEIGMVMLKNSNFGNYGENLAKIAIPASDPGIEFRGKLDGIPGLAGAFLCDL
jgi:hypothetical protein